MDNMQSFFLLLFCAPHITLLKGICWQYCLFFIPSVTLAYLVIDIGTYAYNCYKLVTVWVLKVRQFLFYL